MKSNVYDNMEVAQEYLARANEILERLRVHLRGTDLSELRHALQKIEAAQDVLENGF